MKYIRNFSIIAHINHGKSTLSNKIIEFCNNFNNVFFKESKLEKKKGITIESKIIKLFYNYKGINYILNLIDTPGHNDFSNEVYKYLNACEGVILVIDINKGIEAQTLSNFYLAKKLKLKIIFVLNKIDIVNINFKEKIKDIQDILNINIKNIIFCSSNSGFGIKNLIINIIKNLPFPKGKINNNLKAIVINSWFDNYKGILLSICIKSGKLKLNDSIKFLSNNNIFHINNIGIFKPYKKKKNILKCGEIGWITLGIKKLIFIKIGDVIIKNKNNKNNKNKNIKIKKIKPKIFASIFPVNSNKYKIFCKAFKILSLNDFSLYYEKEKSYEFGIGYKCGFLGLLHLDIIKYKLKKEYKIKFIITKPNILYKIENNKSKFFYINDVSKLNLIKNIKNIYEPIVKCYILTPKKYYGKIINLCINKRGIQINIIYYNNKILIVYNIPMIEIILNFYNFLKSISSGYASLNYNFSFFKISKMVIVDLLINSKKINSFSMLMHSSNAKIYSLRLINKIKKFIFNEQYEIFIKILINKKVFIKHKIKQLRKNVISKCYGGDISRKKKLLKKQKKGKNKINSYNYINKKILINIFKALKKI